MRQYYQTKINKKAGQNTQNFFDAVNEIMGEYKNLEIKEVESKVGSLNNFFVDLGRKLTEEFNAKRNETCIRLLAPSISPFLCEVFNSCLNFGLFPNRLKFAKVIPIFKEGDESDPLTYRPVSLLSVLSKIFQKIIFNRIIVFLNK